MKQSSFDISRRDCPGRDYSGVFLGAILLGILVVVAGLVMAAP
jgi:hypothetical protein